MKKIYFIVLFLFVIVSNSSGQTTKKKMGFVNFHFGRYGVLSKSFTKYYETRFGNYYGASFGVPLSYKISLVGRITYFKKEGIPIYEVTNLREGSAILKEGIVELGIQVKHFFSESVHFIVSTGITIAAIDEERFSPTGHFTYEIEGNGNFGIYLGGAIEFKFGRTPFSIVNELNYIYSWNPLLEYESTYQALNFITGLRFYFGGK